MDNRAVSPVIGIIIMVAITVVMATVVYVASNNYADDAQTVPKINAQLDDHPDALTTGGAMTDALVTIEFRGGDCIAQDDMAVQVISQTDGTRYAVTSDAGAHFCTGDVLTISEDGTQDVPAGGYKVRIIFTPQQFISFESGVNIA